MKRTLLAVALAALAAPAAHATLSLTVLDNGLPVDGTFASPSPGVETFTLVSDPAFTSLSVTVTGEPAIPSPDLGVININARSATSHGLHILTVDAVQSNLPAFTGGTGEVTYTTNTLIGSPGPAILNTNFGGASIASHTFPVGTGTDTFKTTVPLGAEAAGFTDTQDLTVTFGGSTAQLFQSSSQLKTVATPEPAGIALFGVGLLGLAIGARRRRF